VWSFYGSQTHLRENAESSLYLLWLAVARPAHALTARLGYDGGNANAARAADSATLEMDHLEAHWGYAVYARRETLPRDRTLTNASAFGTAGGTLEGHSFFLGLGAHFRQQILQGRSSEIPGFLPAAAFFWRHDVFHTEIAASEKMSRAALAILFTAGIPWEISGDFEYLDSQPYRWSLNAFAFVSRYGGLIVGYEPLALRGRAGVWLSLQESLQLRSVVRFTPGLESFWEFSLQFTFDVQTVPREQAAAAVAAVQYQEKSAPLKSKTVPAFGTLVKWGLTPVEALKLTREKNICALSAASRAALKKHHWECREAGTAN
jgi:hypothetical protein